MPAAIPSSSVAIVGAGPVGLGVAVALGRLGVACTVLEQRTGDERLHPTANHLGTRQMEIVRRWGLEREVVAGGHPPDQPDRRYWMDRLDGHVIYEIERHAGGRPPALDHSPTHEMWISKGTFDPLLLGAARSMEPVDIRYATKVVGLEPTTTGVDVSAEGPTGRHRVHADYLVACDGARSLVRDSIGVEVLGPLRPGIVLQSVWFRARELVDLLPTGGLHYTMVDPGGMLVALDRPGDYRIHVPSFGASDQMSADEGAALVRDAVGRPDLAVEVFSCAPWELSISLATRWRDGRVFLAGDAAKAATPFGGLGMGYGLLDADNLAWKLAAALDGWGGDALLDSYDAERRPAAEQLLAYQGARLRDDPPHLDSRLIPPFPDPAVLDEGPAGHTARVAYRDALATHNEGHYDNVGIDVDQRYTDSPVVVTDGTPEPAWDESAYRPCVRAGHRFPHAWLSGHESTLDRFGAGFVLVTNDAERSCSSTFVDAARSRGVPLGTFAMDTLPEAGTGGPTLALVRPDGYVAWAGREPPSDPGALLDTARGANGYGAWRQWVGRVAPMGRARGANG